MPSARLSTGLQSRVPAGRSSQWCFKSARLEGHDGQVDRARRGKVKMSDKFNKMRFKALATYLRGINGLFGWKRLLGVAEMMQREGRAWDSLLALPSMPSLSWSLECISTCTTSWSTRCTCQARRSSLWSPDSSILLLVSYEL